ncbi:MAG: ANTAR domain-containing protein [Propionicimonas sp.]
MSSDTTQAQPDDSWWVGALAAIQDGAVVFDDGGRVLGVNEAFAELLGYAAEDGPLAPPFPWWPGPDEDADALAVAVDLWQRYRQGEPASGECRLYRADRRPVWVRTVAVQLGPVGLQTFRAIDREKAAQERRLEAAEVSADFATADDLETVLAVAENGLGVLFDGGSTVQLNVSSEPLFLSRGTLIPPEDLPEPVRDGLAGLPDSDAVVRRPGILLAPPSAEADCRVWIQFSQPRRIAPDEMIVADLLAQAFALAVDRVLAAEQAADRLDNLSRAVDSHRLIGQAVGILIERHRLTPAAAFQRLKVSSHNRNLKIRELAARVIDSGLDPQEA